MQHLDEGTIHSWLDGALSADEAARVEAHVAECPQCAAAVAEARGFIAASSRILTALDNVPRGVVPVARPAKWRNPAVWRAAAAVFVVAAGTLVVTRTTDRNTKADYERTESADTAPSLKSAPPLTIMAKPMQTAPAGGQSTAGSVENTGEKRVATDAAASSQPAATRATSRAADMGKAPAAAQRNIPSREGDVVTGQVAAAAGRVAPPPGYANVTPAPPPILLRGNSYAIPSRDSTVAVAPLKVIGTPRQIGAKVTLYEVPPNDTVTLTEVVSARLESEVVTSMPVTQPQERRSMDKSSAAAPPQRADVAAASAQDSQREAGAGAVAAAQSRAPSVPAPVTAVGSAGGVTTIRWTDPATGNVLKLSGRIPLAQLQQIKTRIERERSAAAAAAKKNP